MTNINYTLKVKDLTMLPKGFLYVFGEQIKKLLNDVLGYFLINMGEEDKNLFDKYLDLIIGQFDGTFLNIFSLWNFESINFMDFYAYEKDPWYIVNDEGQKEKMSYEDAGENFAEGIIWNEFLKWVYENQLIIITNFKSLQLSNSDTYKTERTYTINKNDNSNSTYKEGFNGGGLQNQQGTKLSNSSTTTNTQTGTDTDKYNQTDTLRQLNYLQQLKPLDYMSFINNIKNRLLVTIWSD